MSEKTSIEIALFEADYGSLIVWKNENIPDGWTRVSELLTVEFEPLSRDEITRGKLACLKVKENALRDTFARDLRRIETKRQNLLALTNEAAP
jgi:hypothetical protein